MQTGEYNTKIRKTVSLREWGVHPDTFIFQLARTSARSVRKKNKYNYRSKLRFRKRKIKRWRDLCSQHISHAPTVKFEGREIKAWQVKMPGWKHPSMQPFNYYIWVYWLHFLHYKLSKNSSRFLITLQLLAIIYILFSSQSGT